MHNRYICFTLPIVNTHGTVSKYGDSNFKTASVSSFCFIFGEILFRPYMFPKPKHNKKKKKIENKNIRSQDKN